MVMESLRTDIKRKHLEKDINYIVGNTDSKTGKVMYEMNGKYLKEIKENSLTLICESLNEMKALHISHFSKKVLELFKGTGSVGHVAKEYGFEVIIPILSRGIFFKLVAIFKHILSAPVTIKTEPFQV